MRRLAGAQMGLRVHAALLELSAELRATREPVRVIGSLFSDSRCSQSFQYASKRDFVHTPFINSIDEVLTCSAALTMYEVDDTIR